ncbi:MAG TPA: hypothetical protein VES62_07815 [Thermoleophilaceae bacterium]|nr:hypothetical protein [Thermoleophilaceae bacterium]
MAPLADGATLASEVWPIYRPDLEEIAYYEFTVPVGPAARQLATSAAGLSALLAAERDRGQGFILVATGPHDFPIPHWSLDRPPISSQLAGAAERGAAAIERITKIDSLAYIAEAKDGSLVAQVGQVPALLSGLPHDLSRAGGEISTLLAEPAGDVPNDDRAEGVEHRVKREGGAPPDLKPIEVDGWPAFRERYADAFGPYLDQLRRQAVSDVMLPLGRRAIVAWWWPHPQ